MSDRIYLLVPEADWTDRARAGSLLESLDGARVLGGSRLVPVGGRRPPKALALVAKRTMTHRQARRACVTADLAAEHEETLAKARARLPARLVAETEDA